MAEGSKRNRLRCYLVFVSAHANSCMLCIPWQGKVLIDDVFSHPDDEYIAKYKGTYKLLSRAIKSGLLHPNCRHTIATYFEGITKLPEVTDEETVQKNYIAEQKQRYLENKIRLAKRIKAGIVDQTHENDALLEVKKYQKALREHLEKNPQLKRRANQEKVYEKSASTNRLDYKEKEAIIKYISPDAYILNDKIRRGTELSDTEKTWVKHLNTALDKMPTFEGKVTRSVEFLFEEDLAEFETSHIAGMKKKYSQYLSSTKGSVYNEDANVQFEIISKTARDISFYNPSEQEVVFKPETQFFIMDIKEKNGVYYIKMEEL